MTALPEQFEGVANVHLEALEHGNRIVFMHRVRPGPANRSYGLQVASLAGVPRVVIENARSMLEKLETGDHELPSTEMKSQYALFPDHTHAALYDAQFAAALVA